LQVSETIHTHIQDIFHNKIGKLNGELQMLLPA